MINNSIDINAKLNGQYRFSILRNGNSIYTSQWQNNTILSGGLVDLYTYDIPDVLNYLDLGSSSLSGGSAGYCLSGVITPTVFTNIQRDNIDIYTEGLSSKVYYVTFTSLPALSNLQINEFAIKRDHNNGFARNIFSVYITKDDIINFEYKLSVTWKSTAASVVSLTGNNTDYSFNIPAVSTTYNIPYDRVYYNNNYLHLLGNTYKYINSVYTQDDTLPAMGDLYPIYYEWGISNDEGVSSYSPKEIYNGIDHTTRSYTVTTLYNNISCATNSGIFSNIKSALLVKDGNTEVPIYSFHLDRFAYPLTVYNDTYICGENDNCNRYNVLSLIYNYKWS
jgi:hypothetical protein